MKTKSYGTFNSLKKLTLALAAGITASLTPINSYSQVAFSIGPKVGYSVTSFSGDVGSFQARTSWQAGLFANLQIIKPVAIQPEFLFTQRGATVTENNVRTDVKLSYFEVPVLLKLRLPIEDVFYPHVLIGPNFAFNTSASTEVRDTPNGQDITFKGGDVSKADIGALLGAGFDVQSGRLFFTMDARYAYGFNSIYGSTVSLRNVGWIFSAGIGLRIGGGDED